MSDEIRLLSGAHVAGLREGREARRQPSRKRAGAQASRKLAWRLCGIRSARRIQPSVRMKKTPAYLLLVLSEVLGGGSLVLFAIFVFAGPVVSVRLGFNDRGVLYWDALLSLFFFAQHSVMVRTWFKDWLALRVSRDFHAAIYSVASGVALGITMVFWQASPVIVAAVTGPAAWLLRVIAVLAIAGFVWGARSLRTFDTFGRLPITARLRGQTLPPPELIVRGAYVWVRHPLMLFMTVLMWANPEVSADRALFNVLWTVWLVIGSFFEERDLLAEFGDQYRAYQRVVPMLLPWRGPAGRVLQRPAVAADEHALTRA